MADWPGLVPASCAIHLDFICIAFSQLKRNRSTTQLIRTQSQKSNILFLEKNFFLMWDFNADQKKQQSINNHQFPCHAKPKMQSKLSPY